MDTWDLLMEYFMFVVAGIAGGLSLAIYLDTGTDNKVKPFLAFIFLLLFFFVYLLFAKAREISRKKNNETH